tara:strand:+ start:1826 stop:2134 length:309 start_codon:yes stop_codon:yes gene_type:complete
VVRDAYDVVMNPEINPLRGLPKIVRFQLMSTLALMWSIVFSVWSGMITLVGPSMAAHVVLLIGMFFTADVFRRASRKKRVDHRAHYRDPSDGCARYDDLWGA